MPFTVNSHALTAEKPCINKGFLELLMHRKLTFNMIVPGPLKLFRHTLFNCHNTINWWCNRPIKMDPLKKMLGPDFWTPFSGWESATLLITLESRLYYKAVRFHLIPIITVTTPSSINYVIISLFIRHHVVKQNWKQWALSSYFYDVKLRVKQLWKKTCCKISASKNCRMAQEWIRIVQNGNYGI